LSWDISPIHNKHIYHLIPQLPVMDYYKQLCVKQGQISTIEQVVATSE